MNEGAIKLALDDVQRMMRSDSGGKWPSEDKILAALKADHSGNGGRYPTTDEVLELVTKDPNHFTARAFPALNALLQVEP